MSSTDMVDGGVNLCHSPPILARPGSPSKCNNVSFNVPVTQREKDRDSYKCTHCSLIFKHLNTLQSHKRVHSDVDPSAQKPFSCLKCGEAFEYYAMLERHKLDHKATKGYKCNCGRTFIKYTDLLYHTHADEAEHHSEQRGTFDAKGLMLPSYRAPARATNTFYCEYCFKSFSDSHMLTAHMYSHRKTTNKYMSSTALVSPYTPSISHYSAIATRPSSLTLSRRQAYRGVYNNA